MTTTLQKPSAIADAEAAVLLIEKNKLRMAMPILRRLPAAIEAELVRASSLAWLQGRASAEVERRRQVQERRDRQSKPSRLGWLHQLAADPAKRERAKELLGLCDELLDRILAGTLELSPGQRRKLRRELGP
jgi:hypothetical protein